MEFGAIKNDLFLYEFSSRTLIPKMAGLYIHIPFCRKLCYYCDFHFTVSFKQKKRVLDSIGRELIQRKEEFIDNELSTIYFGGGTPSILSSEEINNFIEIIEKNYKISSDVEITIETNPDDLTRSYLSDVKQHTPINRLSIGVQSFNDHFLKLMNRRHSAKEALKCIVDSQEEGFGNINIDLIYGIPGMTLNDFKEDLETFSKLKIPHLSAYHLSIEPKTVFAHYQKRGKIKIITEEESLKQFEFLIRFLSNLGYEHYEISNFALPNAYSKHNLGYWTGQPYLGVGPSAHSFKATQRRWNVSVNSKYCDEIERGGEGGFEIEFIDMETSFHDYLITALRTKWGIHLETINTKFGDRLLQHIYSASKKFIDEGLLINQKGNIYLSNKGKLIADYIIREMMLEKKS